MSVPKLRFPEFNEDLKKVELGKISHIKTGSKDLQDNVIDGKYPFFVRSNKVERINSYSYDGEAILVPGDGVNVGKIYHYINGKFDFHQRVYKISDFDKSYSGKFIYYFLKKNFLRQALENSLKASVDSLRLPTIKEMPINSPNILEQEKIASFLSKIDEKIEKLEKKQELWETYKKGMMRQIFTQKLRFKDENGESYPDWELKKLGDFVSIKSGQSPTGILTDNGKIPYFKVDQLNNSNKYQIETPYFMNNNKIKVEKGSIIFPKRGAAILLNKVRILNQDSSMDTNLMTLTTNNHLNNEFLYYFILKEKLYKIADTSSIPQINNKHIIPYQIYTPNLDEQEKIATFLSVIDNKIELVNNELEINKEFKKGLLQQIFC